MPENFPEAWQNRVETNLTAETEAPWLAGVAELDTTILEVGSGAATEQNIIHIPVTDFEPDVLINNNTYPLALQEYDDSSVTIQLDKYQTKVVTLSDDQVMGASYPRIDAATRATTDAILKKKFSKAIHAIAPLGNTDQTPVLLTTGGNDGFGRKRLKYEDLVALKAEFDKLQVPSTGRRLVLSTDHWNDLLLDRERFGDNFSNYRTGEHAPMVAGFELYQYVANPYFTGRTKKPYGSAVTNGLNGVATFGAITGGSSYENGTYDDVLLTGGTGTGATANIVVAGGVVTTVNIVSRGRGYTAGDSLSAAQADLGGAGSGFAVAVATVAPNTEFQASVAFYVPNIAKKTGLTKQYYTSSSIDPENQVNKLAYRHYFIVTPKRKKYIGAIASGQA